MDGFSVLGEDHRKVEHMLAQLVELMPNQSDQDRAQLAQRLVMEESKHEAAEEMYLWPLVRQRCDAGDRLADRAREEESEANSVLDKLRKADPQGQRFSTSVEVFAMLCRAHIAFEENQVWPNLGERLTATEAEDLGQKLQKAEKSGPTRPHPRRPVESGGFEDRGYGRRGGGPTQRHSHWPGVISRSVAIDHVALAPSAQVTIHRVAIDQGSDFVILGTYVP